VPGRGWNDWVCQVGPVQVVAQFPPITTTTTATTITAVTQTTHTIFQNTTRQLRLTLADVSTLMQIVVEQNASFHALSTLVSQQGASQSLALAAYSSTIAQENVPGRLARVENNVQTLTVNSTRVSAAIDRVVSTLTAAAATPPPPPVPCSGASCTPLIQATGSGIVVAARGGTVAMQTAACGSFDPCTNQQQIIAITAALNSLRGS
jgi:hypothetical protein